MQNMQTCLELKKICDVKLPSSLLAMVLLALLLADLEAVSAVLVLDMVALEAAVVVVVLILVLVVLSFTLVVVLVVVTLLIEAFGAGTCLAMAVCSAATAAVLAGGGDEGVAVFLMGVLLFVELSFDDVFSVEALRDCAGDCIGSDDFFGSGINFCCSCFTSFCVFWEATGVELGTSVGEGWEELMSLKVTEDFSGFSIEEGCSFFAMGGLSAVSGFDGFCGCLSEGTSAAGFKALGGLSVLGFVALGFGLSAVGGCLITVELPLISVTSFGDFFGDVEFGSFK